MSGHNGEVYALAFTTDSRSLFSASGDRTVRVWDATQFSADGAQEPTCRTLLHSTNPEDKPSKKAVFTSVAVDTTGSFVAAGSLDGIIRVWNVCSDSANDAPIGILHGHSDGVYGVQFLLSNSENSSVFLVSASLDSTLKYWELFPHEKQFTCTKTLNGHKAWSLCLRSQFCMLTHYTGCCFVRVGAASRKRTTPRLIIPRWNCPPLGLEEWDSIFHDPGSHKHWYAVPAMIRTPHPFLTCIMCSPKSLRLT